MRKVICRATGEVGYNDEFYKAPNGRYYKTKEIYDKSKADYNIKKNIAYLVNVKILNKPKDNYISLIMKLINESGLEPNLIYDSIIKNMEYIKKAIKESNNIDSVKIHTIFAIVENKLDKVAYAGCYEIRNNKTNEIYIGESINLFSRIVQHISDLYDNKHHCQKLQDAFNETKSISSFTITPLFMFPIPSVDKNIIKHDTLYLESAFYMISKNNRKKLYNTQNPYR